MKMKKETTYSLLAMAALFAASVGLGVYALIGKNVISVGADTTIQALPEYNVSCRVVVTPLKSGLNSFENGVDNFAADSRVVVAGKELLSFVDAQKRGIIRSVRNVSQDVVLSESNGQIDAGDKFAVEVLDISSSPALCIGGLK